MVDKCNFCGSITKEYKAIKNLPVFTGIPNDKPRKDCLDFSLVLCEHCGLIQQSNSESLDEKLKKIYVSKEASLSTPLGKGVWGSKRLGDFLEDADIRHIPNEILEIGCGSGGLLSELFKKGHRNLSCFEPSSMVKDIPKLDKDFSPQIYNEFFSSEVVRRYGLEGKYDLIVFTAVLEHIKDVEDFLLAVRLALKDEGIGILTVPNGLFELKTIDLGLMIHEHLNCFTPTILDAILSVSGLGTFYMKVKKDLLLAKFRKKDKFLSKIKRNSLSNAINENEALLKKYAENLPMVISKFEYMVDTRKGRNIGLYGACATAFNLLALSNIDEFKNLFFIDSDSLKWHKKLFGIPIIPPSELSKYDINSIFIIPPAFQDDITEYLVSLDLPENIEIVKLWD